MPEVTTLIPMILAVLSWAVIVAFGLVMYEGFRIQDPPLSPFQSIVTIAAIFVLAYAVLNTKSCRTFVNHPVEEAAGGEILHASN
jgi:hypothetical protein